MFDVRGCGMWQVSIINIFCYVTADSSNLKLHNITCCAYYSTFLIKYFLPLLTCSFVSLIHINNIFSLQYCFIYKHVYNVMFEQYLISYVSNGSQFVFLEAEWTPDSSPGSYVSILLYKSAGPVCPFLTQLRLNWSW